MNSNERRDGILNLLKREQGPLSATAIAKQFQVSRQIIVGDIALLRAAGEEISATPRGYLYSSQAGNQYRYRTIACRHSRDQIREEFYTVVDNGCAILDVTVEHVLYGQILGQLQIDSRYDADQFLNKLERTQAAPLSSLTDGIHLHTIQYQEEDAIQRVIAELAEKGILFEDAAAEAETESH